MSRNAGLSSLTNLLEHRRAKQGRRQDEEDEEEEDDFENGIQEYEQKQMDDMVEEEAEQDQGEEEEEFMAPLKKKQKNKQLSSSSSSSHEEDDTERLRREKEELEKTIAKLKADQEKMAKEAGKAIAASSATEAKEWGLSDKKKVTVEKFKGKILIHVREYYTDGGEMKPTKKGIALNTAEWYVFISYCYYYFFSIVDTFSTKV